jgi:hypothetical protein
MHTRTRTHKPPTGVEWNIENFSQGSDKFVEATCGVFQGLKAANPNTVVILDTYQWVDLPQTLPVYQKCKDSIDFLNYQTYGGAFEAITSDVDQWMSKANELIFNRWPADVVPKLIFSFSTALPACPGAPNQRGIVDPAKAAQVTTRMMDKGAAGAFTWTAECECLVMMGLNFALPCCCYHLFSSPLPIYNSPQTSPPPNLTVCRVEMRGVATGVCAGERRAKRHQGVRVTASARPPNAAFVPFHHRKPHLLRSFIFSLYSCVGIYRRGLLTTASLPPPYYSKTLLPHNRCVVVRTNSTNSAKFGLSPDLLQLSYGPAFCIFSATLTGTLEPRYLMRPLLFSSHFCGHHIAPLLVPRPHTPFPLLDCARNRCVVVARFS